jgi:hypothetical protein
MELPVVVSPQALQQEHGFALVAKIATLLFDGWEGNCIHSYFKQRGRHEGFVMGHDGDVVMIVP